MKHDKIEADFRRRHPAIAAEQAALRARHRRAHADYGHSVNATPETLARAARVSQGAMARLFMGGHLSIDQLAWSAEIRTVAERIGRDVAIGTVSLETRVDNGFSGHRLAEESLGRVRAEVAYSGWRAALRRPAPVLAMIVDDIAVRSVARHYRMRDAGARALLIDALDAWPDWCADARDRVDEDDLAAMAWRLR
ncbi:MAG: hypothetical protein V2I27_04730 [Erythrobacter sp.]|nr:hypothetical protein [Erythrobacter sp.]